MKRIRLFTLSFALMLCANISAAPISLTSPNGKLKIDINLGKSITYSVSCEDEVVLSDCEVGLYIDHQVLGENPKLKTVHPT